VLFGDAGNKFDRVKFGAMVFASGCFMLR